jgi:long-chain fatty acid transport protein
VRRLGAAAAVLLAAAPAAANPVDVFGFGARGAAMASAQVAAADDASATYYNPALLVRSEDVRIDVGFQAGLPRLFVDGEDLGVDPSHGTTIGLLVPGVVAGRAVAVGAGVFLPDQHITRTRALPSPRPRFALYDNRPQRLFLSADVAVELRPGLSVGAGLAYMSGTQGEVLLQGLVGFPQPEASNLALSIDVDLRTVRYPHAGLAWQALPWLNLGLSYRGGFTLQIDQTVRIDGDVGLPDLPPVVDDGFLSLRSVSQDLFQPAQLTAGLAAQLTPATAVAFDLAWHRWSVFDNPAAELTIDLDIGQFNEFVDLPPDRPIPAPHYHDTVVPRLGVERVLGRGDRVVRARGGYAYEPSPAPEQFGETNFIDSDRHLLSAGAGLELPGLGGILVRPVALDAFVGVTVLEPRAHRKLSPVDPVGSYRSTGWLLSAGVTSRWRF